MATGINRGTYWGIAGLLFNVAGLLTSTFDGDIFFGGALIVLGLACLTLGIRERKRASAPKLKPDNEPKPKIDGGAA